MFTFHKWLGKEKCAPIYIRPGDSIQLSHSDEFGITKNVITRKFDKQVTISETGIFEADVDGRYAIGGVFIEKEA